MRGVALGALGDVFVLFRIVRHISMGTDLFAAGRHVIGGSFNDLAEGAMAAETLVFRLRTQNPGENQNANAAEKQPNSHALSLSINRFSRTAQAHGSWLRAFVTPEEHQLRSMG